MQLIDLIQAVFAGVCFYAGITHLMIGLRSQPKDWVHLSFSALSLLFGIYSLSIFMLYVAFDVGSLSYYVYIDRFGIALWYLTYAAFFWFIAAYTGARNHLIPLIVTGLYAGIAVLSFILPYPWIYVDIALTDTFPPDIVLSPWYRVEQGLTLLLIIVYSGDLIFRQFQRGETRDAQALGAAVGIIAITILWDYGIEYGMIDTVLIGQYGFVALIVIMSLRLSNQVVETKQDLRNLNVELEERVEVRTVELTEMNNRLQRSIIELSTLHVISQTMVNQLELQEALITAAENTANLYQSPLVLITTPSETGDQLTTLVGFGSQANTDPVFERSFPLSEMPVSRHVMEAGESQFVPHVSALDLPDELQSLVDEFHLGSFLLVPLQAHGQALGILALGFNSPELEFSAEDFSLAETIASDIAAAIENKQLQERARMAAVDAERQRLARELHDSVTQSIYSLTLLCGGWESMAAQGTLENPVGSFHQLGDISLQALREMRLLIHQLRPSVLDEVGLVQALQQRLDSVELRANIDANLKTRGELDDLPHNVEEQLFYISQEALNNSLRHAHASQVVVELVEEGGHLNLSIEDDGRGFDPSAETSGMGLHNIKERSDSIQAEAVVSSNAGNGTRISVDLELPLEEMNG